MIVTKEEIKPSTFDAEPCLDSTIDDLDVELFRTDYLSKVLKNNVSTQDKRTTEQQLVSLNLYDAKQDCPSVAGILLFGKDPVYFLPGAYIQYVKFEGINRASKILTERQFDGNLITMLKAINSFIKHNEVVSELIINNVMHREYHTNSPSKFYEYADRIEIDNPGSLYEKATIANFPNETDYRNPILAKILKELGYANCLGCGIDRIQDWLEENGQIVFDFKDFTTFKATFLKNINLPERYKNILDHIKKNPYLTRQELADLERISISYISSIINGLKEKGMIECVGNKKSGYWKIRWDYTKTETEKIDFVSILSHIKKNPAISVSKLSNIIGITSNKMSSVVSQLKQEGLLERIGKQSHNSFWKLTEKGIQMVQNDIQSQQNYKNSTKSLDKIQNKILEYISENPYITTEKLSSLIGITITNLKRNITLLKKNNFLKRTGTNEKGYWKIDMEKGIETVEKYYKNQQQYKKIIEDSDKKFDKNQRLVLGYIIKNPFIRHKELMFRTGFERQNVYHIIKKLKENRILIRMGGIKDGYWKIRENDTEDTDTKSTKELTANEKLILDKIAKSISITAVELSNSTGIKEQTVRNIILKLKIGGYLKRIGGTGKYIGHWKVIRNA